MEQVPAALAMALSEAFNMAWEVLWPLILGFALSGAVQAVVSHRSMARLLGDDSPRCLTLATLFGIASSSCSYAAAALARSLFLKGASFTAAMVFELASTNLVIELGVVLVVLMACDLSLDLSHRRRGAGVGRDLSRPARTPAARGRGGRRR